MSGIIVALLFTVLQEPAQAAGNRSTYIPYDVSWFGPPDFRTVAFDQVHQQIFTAWSQLDRVDVLSASDYHLIRSIVVPSPSTLDISPDGSALAVGTFAAHILFFDTGTFAKTNEIVFPDSALGITAFVYTANGNAFVRAGEGLSTGGGITAYWNYATNSFSNESNAMGATGSYNTTGPLARSGDYSRILLGDASSGGGVQIIDGNTGDVLQSFGFGGYIIGLAANNSASRFAICVEPAGFANILVILDSSYNEIYQDEAGCGAMAFSRDGNTLYRDAPSNGVASTQSIDMSTFAIRNTQNYFSNQPGSYPIFWQDADGTGMVYGLNPNIPNGGTIFVAVDTTVSSTGNPPPLNDPVHIIRVIDNVGSPQGGDLIRILCTGVDNVGAGSVSVKFGGTLATGIAVSTVAPSPNIPNLQLITAKTPAGSPGLVNVTLGTGTASDTATGAFQYAQATKLFPFSTSPNFLLYDASRQKLYAAHKDQVEVIDPIAQQVLTPLVPAGGKLANSQFAGLSLSPDGTKLYIADAGANLIHIIDLTNPGNGSSIDPGKALGSSNAVSPARVFETSTGELVGSPANGGVFRINTGTGFGTWMTDSFGQTVGGFAWTSTNQGQFVFITTGINGLISGRAGFWDANASQYTASNNEIGWPVEADANQDGTIIAEGGSTPGIQSSYPELVDFSLDSMGFLEQHFDVGMPTGTPSFFFHPSGALLYKAGLSAVGGSVEIDDVHQWQPAATITFPEPFVTSYSPVTDRMLAIDNTGTYLFGVTNSGITMMVLNTEPLSIGNLQPSFASPSGGGTITLRGSGFQPGAVVAFDGVQASTTYVDQNTLTAVLPSLPAGWQDVSVTNASGISYTAPGLFRVVSAQLSPVISGFSPSPLAISPIAVYPTPVTILGSGFESYDWVEINGQPVESSYTDSGHIQATIPWEFLGKTGTIPFTVVSPYDGYSNTLSLSLVNTVPTIHSLWPLTLASGGAQVNFDVYGVNYVSGSQVYWNGQPLATQVVGGSTAGTGDELLIATVPATLLATAGTGTITVVNPAPGGGTSNSLSMDVSPAHPFVVYPSTIDFGTALLNYLSTQTLQLQNVGSANYTISSISMSSGPFSVISQSNCTNTPFSPFYAAYCIVQLQFSPTLGQSNATLTIVDNAPGSPHNIPVTGTGTQTLVPTVTLGSINALGQPVSAQLAGNAVLGGSNIPATAWIEYGTDPQLSTYSSSPTWSFTGDGGISGSVAGLSPSTTYAARLAVKTPGGVGRSPIGVFATMAAWPELALALAPGSSNVATIHAGQTATYQLVISDGGNGYTGTASFSCSGAPSGTTCSVSPASVQVGVNATAITVTIPTSAGSSAAVFADPARRTPTDRFWNFALLCAAFLPFAIPRSCRRVRFACISVSLAFITACGGSSSTPGGQGTPPTASGTYYLTVNATSGGAQTSYLLTLTVN